MSKPHPQALDPLLTTETSVMDPNGRILILVRVHLDPSRRHVTQVEVMEYGLPNPSPAFALNVKAFQATMQIEGVVLPVLMQMRLREIKAQMEKLHRFPPLILRRLSDALIDTQSHGLAMRDLIATRCAGDPLPDGVPALEPAQRLLRLWCRAPFFGGQEIISALRASLASHGRVDTPFAAEVARTIRIIRYFKSLAPRGRPL